MQHADTRCQRFVAPYLVRYFCRPAGTPDTISQYEKSSRSPAKNCIQAVSRRVDASIPNGRQDHSGAGSRNCWPPAVGSRPQRAVGDTEVSRRTSDTKGLPRPPWHRRPRSHRLSLRGMKKSKRLVNPSAQASDMGASVL